MRARPTTCVLTAAITLAGCAVTTEGGPFWEERGIAGSTPQLHCLTVFEIELSGQAPQLEQTARRAILEAWTPARDDCPPEFPARRLEVRELAVSVPVDAYALPPVGSEVPGPARMRVSVSGRFREVGCLDGAARERLLERSTWIPYIADPWLREEKAAAAVREIVPRLLHIWAAEEAPEPCLAKRPVSTPAETAPSGEGMPGE